MPLSDNAFGHLELDHIYAFVESEASARQLLARHHLQALWPAMVHQGQGTASIAVGYADGYIELVWVTDSDLLRSAEQQHRANLTARAHWRSTNAVPFGIGLRAKNGQIELPDSLWRPYSPTWLRGGRPIQMLGAVQCEIWRPSVFVVPEVIAYPTLLNGIPEELSKSLHKRSLNGAKLSAPGMRIEALVDLGAAAGISLSRSSLSPSLYIPDALELILPQ
ncbi:hypothetical protein RN01_30935 [Cupriavidus sp. SHE]|jgi:hypothetical protein|uniref:hypothetical protein n=1 Tax=Cupriavidus sp. U2 TaxID=2920269 RepID=UPI0005792228|nr:hypothetical protein [Cupriavidus sp. U2]KAI3590398.1 hypothetical protein D9X30_4631 [Cupriavidus sp. U2]KWR74216.1 hypothetical protein RN01_30935 [Cupriavidus sp. SHE]